MRDHGTLQRSEGPAVTRNDRTVVVAVVATAVAVVCCAGGPALLAVLGGLGLALSAAAGLAAGVVAFSAAVGALVFVMRQRRGSSSPAAAKQVAR